MDLTFVSKDTLSDWIKKEDSTILCLQEIQLTIKDTHKLNVRGWKKIYQACRNWKQKRVAMIKSDKEKFKQWSVRRDKEGHYILIIKVTI
jgi:exonuclease III